MHQSETNVRIFIAKIEDFNQSQFYKNAGNLLSDTEQIEMERFQFKKDRDLYLAARFLLRTKLTEMEPCSRPEEWTILKDSFGKPYLDTNKHMGGPHFNISHSKAAVACAFSNIPNIGVDIEYNRTPIEILDIAEQNFSPHEIQQLLPLPPEEQLDLFYKIWTLKESYIKGVGKGLAIPLKDFYFDLSKDVSGDIAFLTENGDDRTWKFRLFRPYPDYYAAIAVPTEKNLQLSQTFVDFKDSFIYGT
jgi:4'-phosphopantetheinyl transferase